jgi:hypothetical protein
MFFVQGHMQRENKTCRFGPQNCLEDMTIMYEKSWVSGLSACIPGQEGTADSTPIERQEDHSEEHEEEQVTTSSSTGKNLKRKEKSSKKNPFKKGKNPIVKKSYEDATSSHSQLYKKEESDINVVRDSIANGLMTMYH